MHLYWAVDLSETDVNPADLGASLASLSETAKDMGLDSVVLPSQVLEYTQDAEDNPSYGPTVRVGSWVGAKKSGSRYTSFDDICQYNANGEPRTVIDLNPDKCLELANNIYKSRSYTPFSYATEMLSRYSPRHSYILKHGMREPDSMNDGQALEARRAIASIIAVRLMEPAIATDSDGQRVSITMVGSAIDSDRPRVYMSGRGQASPDGEIIYSSEGLDLAQANGLKLESFRLFFDNPAALDLATRVRVAEMVILYGLTGWDLPIEPDLANTSPIHTPGNILGQNGVKTGQHYPLQRSVARRLRMTGIDTEGAKRSTGIIPGARSFRLLVCIGALSALSTAKEPLQSYLDSSFDAKTEIYVDELPNRSRADVVQSVVTSSRNDQIPTSPDAADEAYDNTVQTGRFDPVLYPDFESNEPPHPTDPIYGARDLEREIGDRVTKLLGIPLKYTESGDTEYDLERDSALRNSNGISYNSEYSGVGNVDPDGKNTPLWRIETSDENMPTSGLWVEKVNNTLYGGVDGLVWQGPDHLESEEVASFDDPESSFDRTIRVTSTGNFPGIESSEQVHSIPVLEGTVPVAARLLMSSYGGSNKQTPDKVTVVQHPDGTFGVKPGTINDPDAQFQVEYWLAPKKDAPKTPFGDVRSMGPAEINDLPMPTIEDGQLLIDAATEVTDRYVPGLPEDPESRTRILADYIGTSLDYSLRPLPRVVSTLPELVEETFKTGSAVCNTANTVLAANNPELNAVVGHRNNGPQENGIDVLSSAEAHMWMVGTDGEQYDATPSGGLSTEEKEFFSEDFKASDLNPPESSIDRWNNRVETAKKIASVGVALAGAGLLMRKRKKIKEAIKNKRSTIASKKKTASIDKANRRFHDLALLYPAKSGAAIELLGHLLFSDGETSKSLISRNEGYSPEELRNQLRMAGVTSSSEIRRRMAHAKSNSLIDPADHDLEGMVVELARLSSLMFSN